MRICEIDISYIVVYIVACLDVRPYTKCCSRVLVERPHLRYTDAGSRSPERPAAKAALGGGDVCTRTA